MPNQTWAHLAGTWDGTVMRVYLNGVMQGEVAAITPPINDIMGPVHIGRGGTTNTWGFRGDVDEVTLYERALAPAEINTIFSAGAAGKCK